MTRSPSIYLGTDGGATTSKVGGVRHDGTVVSTKLLQRPTNSAHGPEAMVAGWIAAASDYLTRTISTWDEVGGVGLAIPGPYQRYGVFGKSPNLPATFIGFDVHTAYAGALAERAGRAVPLVVGNDGNMGGVAEAQRVRRRARATVLMLAPGSGLGCAFVDARGLPLDGDTLSGMEAAHMPAPLHLLDMKPYPVRLRPDLGLRRGLHDALGPSLFAGRKLAAYPNHPLATSAGGSKQRGFAARARAERRSARARDLRFPGARARAARRVARHGARPAVRRHWRRADGSGSHDRGVPQPLPAAHPRDRGCPISGRPQRDHISVTPAALGDLSQAIGAALVALYKIARSRCDVRVPSPESYSPKSLSSSFAIFFLFLLPSAVYLLTVHMNRRMLLLAINRSDDEFQPTR